MRSLLWPFIVILLWSMCHSWNLSNCSPRSESNYVSTILEDLHQNFTSNTSGVDFNVDMQSQNTSEYSTDDVQDYNIRRFDDMKEINKQNRVNEIAKLVAGLRNSNTTNSTSPHVDDAERRRIEQMLRTLPPPLEIDIYTEKIQSFYPACSIPRNADKEAWETEGLFNLYYDINISRPAQGNLKVASAILRLYKSEIPVVDTPVASSYGVLPLDTRETDGDLIPACDELFRISVYQYIKPLKKTKRVRKTKKLIDSRMMAMNHVGWLEFDIRSAIRDWIGNTNKNYGLEIVVEDTEEKTYNPIYFFQNMNCSDVNEPPFPRFMEDEYNNLSGNESKILETKTFPTLDLKTRHYDNEMTLTTTNHILKRYKRESSVNCSIVDFIQNRCCMARVYVSLEDLIKNNEMIAPTGFYTGVCFGKCFAPLDSECCKPVLAPMGFLYFDRENAIERFIIIPDIITTSCQCSCD